PAPAVVVPPGLANPPLGGSSGGSGGSASLRLSPQTTSDGVNYLLSIPSGYDPSQPTPLLLVYSGTEGGQQMASNLQNLGPTGVSAYLQAVLDGVTYNGN